MKILIADPDHEFVTILSYWLRSHGHDSLIAQDANQTLKLWGEQAPELALIDFALPGISGPEFCQRLRLEGPGLIVVLTEARQEDEEVRALEQGADQYLTKPISMRQLQARMNALGRRAQQFSPTSGESQFRLGATIINLARHEVIRNGRHARLTPIEGRLLHLLVSNAGQVIPISTILDRIWGYEDSQTNLIKTHIHHLRQKIEPDPEKPRFLLTLPTIGYILHLQEQAQPEGQLSDVGGSVRSATSFYQSRSA
ncbi:MAG TPA: response regulator transcription factor [Ktedonobacterales bacterium]|jgi:two-component system alkaline phosphatase synthesis response regulator PhoP